MTEESKIVRTSRGLADALFEELDNLRNGKTTPQFARSVSSVATTICAVSRLEMDYARFVNDQRKTPPTSGGAAVGALPMGTEA